VSALRWLLIGIPTNLALDTGVLAGATVAGITVASLLLPGWPAETAKQGSTSRAIGPGMPGGSNFGAPVVAAAGTGPYDPMGQRWGDYSFAVPNTGPDAAWLATEYIPPRSSQTTNGSVNWGTRVFKVRLG
jgi:hypothetical protein